MIWFVVSCAIVLLFFLLINFADMNRFVVRKYRVVSNKIKAPVTIIFLSDLHNKKYGADNSKLIREIDEIGPDLILCGGDMIVASPGRKNENAKSLIAQLAGKYSLYYALGNHEYRADIYPEKYGSMYEDYATHILDSGVKLLRNDSKCELESNLKITGLEIDREYYKRFKTYPMEEDYIAGKIGACEADQFHILLAHNPEYFDNYAQYGADLVLSGHLHGGIVRLPFVGGCASPAIRLFPKYSDGMYLSGNKKMIVSCGLGSHTIPLRIFNPGELTVVSLKPESDSCQNL